MDNFTFSYQELYQFTNTILLNLGCSVDDASIASKVLLSADLRGIDSHGVARLSGYVDCGKQIELMQIPIFKKYTKPQVLQRLMEMQVWD